jgi:hypothetical protein
MVHYTLLGVHQRFGSIGLMPSFLKVTLDSLRMKTNKLIDQAGKRSLRVRNVRKEGEKHVRNRWSRPTREKAGGQENVEQDFPQGKCREESQRS